MKTKKLKIWVSAADKYIETECILITQKELVNKMKSEDIQARSSVEVNGELYDCYVARKAPYNEYAVKIN